MTTVTVELTRWQAKCSTCDRWVWWETVRTDVPGTKAVTICRCESCSRQY